MTNELMLIGVGIITGFFFFCVIIALIYINMKVNFLREKFNKFPTPEELAKEVLKVKLPLSELPPETATEIMKELKLKQQEEEHTQSSMTEDTGVPKKQRTYIQ